MKCMLDAFYHELPVIYLKNHCGNRAFRLMPDGAILKTIDWGLKTPVKKLIKLPKIEHVIFPEQMIHIIFSDLLTYKQEYAKDMYHLDYFSEVKDEYSDKEILMFFKSMLITLSKIHESGVISGDITFANIIMDQNLDYNFIDFELAFIGKTRGLITNCVQSEIPYLCHYDKTMLEAIYNEKDMYKYFDKANLINMFLYAMKFGIIPQNRIITPFSKFESLEMGSVLEDEFRKFMAWDEKTNSYDYMIDVFDHLIDTNYEMPYRKIKR